jgi:pimeloyl-ACP methyl ester carboxylesterase
MLCSLSTNRGDLLGRRGTRQHPGVIANCNGSTNIADACRHIEADMLQKEKTAVDMHPRVVLTYNEFGPDGVDVVCLHWLGGTAETWAQVAHELVPHGLHTIAINLPAFGRTAALPPAPAEQMAIMVEETLARLRGTARDYVLIGHSMGGKVASVMARRAEDGIALCGVPKALILISPSPPAPEPMKESKRAEVMQGLGGASRDNAARAAYAEKFVRDNVGKLQLAPETARSEAGRMLTSSPSAFDFWMEFSSKEDLREAVGTIQTPAILLAGTEDAALGPEAQQQYMMPHLGSGALEILEGAGHLAPIERASEVAFRIARFVGPLNLTRQNKIELSEGFVSLVKSDSTSPQTRRVIEARLAGSKPLKRFGIGASVTLNALIRCVVPSASDNLTSRLEASLEHEEGDGWRFDILAADLKSWEQGLETLDRAAVQNYGVNFAALPARLQTDLLKELQAGKVGKGLLGKLHLGDEAGDLNSEQMKAWFEDVRGELSKLYASDPRTMDRIGFTGFADDKGFDLVELRVTEEQA